MSSYKKLFYPLPTNTVVFKQAYNMVGLYLVNIESWNQTEVCEIPITLSSTGSGMMGSNDPLSRKIYLFDQVSNSFLNTPNEYSGSNMSNVTAHNITTVSQLLLSQNSIDSQKGFIFGLFASSIIQIGVGKWSTESADNINGCCLVTSSWFVSTACFDIDCGSNCHEEEN